MTAFVRGNAVPLEAAATAAAAHLDAARFPLVAGLGTCVAGARAALRLAATVRGAYDHAESAAIARDHGLMSQAGVIAITPGEARQRADLVVLLGLDEGDLGWLGAVFGQGPSTLRGDTPKRSVISLGSSHLLFTGVATDGGPLEDLSVPAAAIGPWLSALRARAAGRRVNLAALAALSGGDGRLAERLDEVAAKLKAARYGVIVWNARNLDLLTMAAAAGLVDDLNATTRFAVLAKPADDGGTGLLQVSGWTTAFPPRTGFRNGFAEHDRWRFAADRLVESGEADLAVWISALSPRAPDWSTPVPLVALALPGTVFAHEPLVRIEVAEPGRDHPAALYDPLAGGFVASAGEAGSSDLPSVAAVIAAIEAKLSVGEGAR